MATMYISTAEAASILEVSTATIRNWAKAGLLVPVARQGRAVEFDQNDLEALKQKIDQGEVKKLDRRANKSGSKVSGGLSLDDAFSVQLTEIFSSVEASNEEQRILLVLAAQLVRFAKRQGVSFSSFLLSKSGVSQIFKEITAEYLIPLDVINVFEKLSDENISDVCKGNYLGLLSSGQLAKSGAFYTPEHVASAMIDDHIVFSTTKVLDPCCGSGAFLIKAIKRLKDLGVKNWNAQVYGIEIDRASALCARLNILYEMDDNSLGYPNVILGDALDDNNWRSLSDVDLIVSNPPWGAKFSTQMFKELKEKFSPFSSRESFSLFMLQSLANIKEGGVISFLAPEAILNVKSHSQIRSLILKKSVLEIQRIGRAFDSVFTDVVRLSLRKSPSIQKNLVSIVGRSGTFSIKQEFLSEGENLEIIPEKTPFCHDVMIKMRLKPHQCLKGRARWALGIVTGNNERYLRAEKLDGYQPVYKGRDIAPFKMMEPSSYLDFAPEKFQQCATPKIFRVKEKLFYKFISEKLCFVRDTSGALSLNSANVVIPSLELPMNVVCALLNSTLMQFYYKRSFSSIKVLRHYLEQLPLPIFEGEDLQKAESFAEKLEATGGDQAVIQEFDDFLFSYYGFDQESIDKITRALAV